MRQAERIRYLILGAQREGNPRPERTCGTKRLSTPWSAGGTNGRKTPQTLACKPGRSFVPRTGSASTRGLPAKRRQRCTSATGHTAGNGSLMRTAPLALTYLDDEPALAEAARAVSELTQYSR